MEATMKATMEATTVATMRATMEATMEATMGYTDQLSARLGRNFADFNRRLCQIEAQLKDQVVLSDTDDIKERISGLESMIRDSIERSEGRFRDSDKLVMTEIDNVNQGMDEINQAVAATQRSVAATRRAVAKMHTNLGQLFLAEALGREALGPAGPAAAPMEPVDLGDGRMLLPPWRPPFGIPVLVERPWVAEDLPPYEDMADADAHAAAAPAAHARSDTDINADDDSEVEAIEYVPGALPAPQPRPQRRRHDEMDDGRSPSRRHRRPRPM